MEMELVGAIKVKDGLFIGDEFAAQDLEFVVANKVSNIINCAGRQVANHWEPIGVNYLTFYWYDHDSQIIFDNKDKVFDEIFNYIDKTIDAGNSVLVHSVRGKTRCICVVTAYMMKKYRWNAYKALEFMHSRRPDIEIRPNFVNQLTSLETRLTRAGFGPRTTKWNELGEDVNVDSEELMLRNTFLNSQVSAMQGQIEPEAEGRERQIRLNWADNGADDKKKLVDIKHPSSKNPVEDGFAILTSCLKGGNKVESRFQIQGPPKGRQDRLKANALYLSAPKMLSKNDKISDISSPQQLGKGRSLEPTQKRGRPSSASKKDEKRGPQERRPRILSADKRETAKRKAALTTYAPFIQSISLQQRTRPQAKPEEIKRPVGKRKRPNTAPNKDPTRRLQGSKSLTYTAPRRTGWRNS